MKKEQLQKKIITLCFVIMSFFIAKGQDIHFSQFYMAPLTQNPAMAGAIFDLQTIINYRDQWKSVATPYRTGAFSYDMKLNHKAGAKGFWAAGINLFSDKAGDAQLKTIQGNLTVAYHVHLTQFSTLGLGIQGGVAQRSINYASLEWANQYNGMSYNSSLPSGEPIGASSSFTYADFGTGMVWAYNNTNGLIHVEDNHDLQATVGFSVFHFTQPKYNFYDQGERLYMKYVLHGNAIISIRNTKMAIVPGFMCYKQGPNQEIYMGALIRYKLQQDSKYTGKYKGAALSLGGYVRAKDAIVASMLLEYSQYAIGISYDINTSSITPASAAKGGFEISIRFINVSPFINGKSKVKF